MRIPPNHTIYQRGQLMRCSLSILLITIGLFLSGCGDGSDPGPTQKTTIAVIPKGTTHEFWK